MNNQFKNFTILYIEDDKGIRDINFSIFKRLFKYVYVACDGKLGYKLYLKEKPDIIITDIKMPKINGIELVKKIRQSDQNTKIIITSAFSDPQFLLDAVELNIERYLVKPLTNRNLIPALEKAILTIEHKKIFSNDFYFDYKTSQFYFNENIIKMNNKELLFLSLLVNNENKILSYEQIEEEIWKEESMSLKSLRTIIGLIRKKIPINIIQNVSNIGYTLKTID